MRAGLIKIRTSIKPGNPTLGKVLLSDQIGTTTLHFKADLVVANKSHVASRLGFDCTPIHEFLGLPVEGRQVVFHEHAFYMLREGKIAEVFSVIDKAAIEAQLRP